MSQVKEVEETDYGLPLGRDFDFCFWKALRSSLITKANMTFGNT